MNKALIFGVGIALAVVSMSSGAVPRTPCTGAKEGEVVWEYSGLGNQTLRIFQCQAGWWELTCVCNQYGCNAP